MPQNLIPASVAPGTVLPQSLCTSFTEVRVYPILAVEYNDGSYERSLIVDTVNPARALRMWTMAKRQTTAQLTALATFFTVTTKGGLNPFWFYDPFGVLPGQKIGSNFDATGSNTQGRVTCFFRGNWSQRTDLGRHTVPSLVLVEVA